MSMSKRCSRCRISLAAMVRISWRMRGWRCRQAWVSRGAIGTEAGMMPRRSTPLGLSRGERASWRRPSQSLSTRRAQASTRSPSSVKPSKRWLRLTMVMPSSASMPRIALNSAGCETWQASAARPKCFSRERATR